MTDRESPAEFVQRVRAYAEKATKGEWLIASRGHPGNAALIDELYVYEDADRDGTRVCTMSFAQGSEAFDNAEFITNARTDLPAALSIIETLGQRIKELEAAVCVSQAPWPVVPCKHPEDAVCPHCAHRKSAAVAAMKGE